MCKHERICSLALEESKLSKQKFQHGAIITKSGKPLIICHNDERTTFNGKFSLCMHSEMNAIIKWLKTYCKNSSAKEIRKKGSKFSLYIIRNNNDNSSNKFAFSKPCYSCTILAKKCNFKKIVYTVGGEEIKIVRPANLDICTSVLTSADRAFKKHINTYKHITNIIL